MTEVRTVCILSLLNEIFHMNSKKKRKCHHCIAANVFLPLSALSPVRLLQLIYTGGKSTQEILFRITSILGITFISKQNLYWNSYYLLAVNKIIFLAAGYKLEVIFTRWIGREYDLFPYCTQNWCCKPEQSHRAIIPNKCNCINLKCIRDPHLKIKTLCHCAVKQTPQASQLKRWGQCTAFSQILYQKWYQHKHTCRLHFGSTSSADFTKKLLHLIVALSCHFH